MPSTPEYMVKLINPSSKSETVVGVYSEIDIAAETCYQHNKRILRQTPELWSFLIDRIYPKESQSYKSLCLDRIQKEFKRDIDSVHKYNLPESTMIRSIANTEILWSEMIASFIYDPRLSGKIYEHSVVVKQRMH
jgi:hypothetical protein